MPSQKRRLKASSTNVKGRPKPNITSVSKIATFSSLIIVLIAVLYYYRLDIIARFPNAPVGEVKDYNEFNWADEYVIKPQKSDQDTDANEPDWPFEVIDMPGKGKGVVAKRDIEQGEMVLREESLLLVPRHITGSPLEFLGGKLKGLTTAERETFYNLTYVNLPAGMDPEAYPEQVALGIVQTNAVSAGENVGVFPRMARFNHGCSRAFNSVYMWREHEQALVVHALKSIAKGQELLTTYMSTRKPRNERRSFLQEHYGFHCNCDVCSLPEEESRASDERLTEISRLYEKFGTWGQKEIDGKEAIKYIRRIWEIEDQEGYWSERGQLAADAAWIVASHSDAEATRAWASTALEWYSYEIGWDSLQVQEMRRVIEQPSTFRPWGNREIQKIGV